MLENLQYVVFIDTKLQLMPRFNNDTHAEIGPAKIKVPVLFDEAIIRQLLPAKIMVVTMDPKKRQVIKSTVIERCETWPPFVDKA
ncbi:hypothetical protein JOAD_182 [Erwinia phage vB_EamM_Joad]|uniref:Uncharacterized protein n=1 Tax=Erwinia phage vB_EamM_Joad TaxID=2026081 RepID=A0A223LIQ2_9CAUD|nr:hypothetical protein JOAD_182 [Erwinia phage vB_EamM_Joad]